MSEWACVCGWWHQSDPHVVATVSGHVIHAPVTDAEAEAVAPLP